MNTSWQINGQHRTGAKRSRSFGPGVRVDGSAARGGCRAIKVDGGCCASTFDSLIGARISSWGHSRSAEFLNAEVIRVDDVEEGARRVRGDILGTLKLSIAAACTSARFDKYSGVGKELHTIISGISHINCSRIIDGNTVRCVELAVPGTYCSPLRIKRAGAIEFLNSIISAVGYIKIVS